MLSCTQIVTQQTQHYKIKTKRQTIKKLTQNSESAEHDNVDCVASDYQSGNIRQNLAVNIAPLFVDWT